MSTVATGGRKRKISDTKPQAQINKCNNEKRRREQESIYIEELVVLLSQIIRADMNTVSAVKPDKCAILKETLEQVKLEKEEEKHEALDLLCVQQGDVSSSAATHLDYFASRQYAPFILEAFDGFLILVSKERRIEQCSSNIKNYIRFTQEEVYHQDLFNFIHLGDTSSFSAALKTPFSLSNWASEESSPQREDKCRQFTCRFLVKPDEESTATLCQRQQHVDKYEQMHVISREVPDFFNDEDAQPNLLMCIVRRIPYTERTKVILSPETNLNNNNNDPSYDQFSTRVDSKGKILDIDCSSVAPRWAKYINKSLLGECLDRLCHAGFADKVNVHLKTTFLSGGEYVKDTFKLAFGNKLIDIQTRSKFFEIDSTEQIMSTHFIVGISDVLDDFELVAAGNDSASGTSSGSVGGGPLMTSVMNGAVTTCNGTRTTETSAASSAIADPNFLNNSDTSLLGNDNEPDLPKWTLDEFNFEDTPSLPSRPNSRHSAVDNTATRSPSMDMSGVASPVATTFATSDTLNTMNNATTPTSTPSAATFTSFSTDHSNGANGASGPDNNNKENLTDENLNDSARLRKLLTKGTNTTTTNTTSASSGSNLSSDDERNKNRILKGLLNHDDADDKDMQMQQNSRASTSMSASEPSKVASENLMLLKLLNEKSDVKERDNYKKQSELLQQLLKQETDSNKNDKHDEHLLRSLGFGTTNVSGSSRKRSSTDDDDQATLRKRLSTGNETLGMLISNNNASSSTTTTSSASSSSTSSSSKLWEKNKMLASLLAKQPAVTSQPIPTLPARVLTATPQELPRLSEQRKMGGFAMQRTRGGLAHPQFARQTPTTSAYLSQIMANNTYNLDLNNRVPTSIRGDQQGNVVFTTAQHYAAAHNSSTNSGNLVWSDHNNDPVLSDLLDQVIDIVPDAYVTDSSALMHILESLEQSSASLTAATTTHTDTVSSSSGGNNANNNETSVKAEAGQSGDFLSEQSAINAIQKSLMQCEAAVKSPSSPPVLLQPNDTPPAYSSTHLPSSTSGGSNYPPPLYPTNARFNSTQTGTNAKVQQYAMAVAAAAAANANAGTILPSAGGIQQQMLLQQRNKMFLGEDQRRRLLQQQQQQAFNGDELAKKMNSAAANGGLETVINLNNTTLFPPNVSVHVPRQSMMASANANEPAQRLYSNAGNQFANAAANNRLSPIQRQQYQSNAQQQAWQQQQPQQRLVANNANQQNAAMLAAASGNYRQLSGGLQRTGVGTLTMSNGNVVNTTRQSAFAADSSYTTGNASQAATNAPYNAFFQQQMQHRLQQQRPMTTSDLPGAIGSPRSYHHNMLDNSPSPLPAYNMHPLHHHHHPHPTNQLNPNQSLHHPGDGPPPPQPPPNNYSDATGSSQYCYEYDDGTAMAYAATAPPTNGGASSKSEFVRQELRAIVGARTGQQSGSGGGAANASQQSQLSVNNNAIQPIAGLDLDALFDNNPPGLMSKKPKVWAAVGLDDVNASTRAIMVEAVSRGVGGECTPGETLTTVINLPGLAEVCASTDHKSSSSLLEKLLSE